MTLSRLQDDLRQWLETGDTDLAARFGEDAAPGLRIYLNNYRLQLLDCLEEAYAHTRSWLGDDRFGAAARRHIMQCPPDSWTLDAYPQTFAAAIGAEFSGEPVVAELAELELAINEAFVARDVAALTRAQFTQLDWKVAALSPAAGARILEHRTNAAAIWSALSREETPPAAEHLADEQRILVWRSDETSCFRPLDADEAEILASLTPPRLFTAICETLVESQGAEAGIARAGQLLARWADEGAVSVASD